MKHTFAILFLLFSHIVIGQQFGEKITNIYLTNISKKQILFPQSNKQVCFFISSNKNINSVLFLLNSIPKSSKISVALFFKSKPSQKQLDIIPSTYTIFVKTDNLMPYCNNLFNKFCETCAAISLMIIENNKIYYYHKGFDAYLFREVLTNIGGQ